MECNHHETLLKGTLKNIWQNYLNAGDDLDTKQHWLELFLYNFRHISEEILKQLDFQSFFNSIPEEICSFFLQRVYDIISKCEYYNPKQLVSEESDNTGSINGKDVAKLIRNNHNFAQLILRAPNDCNKIVALRTFLTHQLGQHLLEFLCRVNIKLVASQKSLCNLCINLFPNCRWNEENYDIELPKTLSIMEYLNEFKVLDKNLHQTRISKHSRHSSTNVNQSSRIPLASKNNVINYLTIYKNHAFKTTDEISHILIDLLMKCVDNESEDVLLSEQSMSTTVLNFALEALLFKPNDIFSSIENACKIKNKLLQLIIHCLNNLFEHAANPNAIQLQFIIARLVIALDTNKRQNSAEYPTGPADDSRCNGYTYIEFGLIYLIFGIINNVVFIFGYGSGSSRAQLYTLKFIDEKVLEVCVQILIELLSLRRDALTRDTEIDKLINCIFKMHVQIIENLSRYDQEQIQQISNVVPQKQPRRRKIYPRQMHCRMPTLGCFFQRLLLDVLPHFPVQLQEYSIQYLLRFGTCCCHYSLSTLIIYFDLVPKVPAQARKNIYKFIYRKFLSTIFTREMQQPGPHSNQHQQQQQQHQGFGKRRNDRNCSKCDTKLKSLEFHSKLVQIYRQLYENLLKLNDVLAISLYLKHVKHIAHLLTNDIAAGILAEIILPIFRQSKDQLITQDQFVIDKVYKSQETGSRIMNVISNYNDNEKLQNTQTHMLGTNKTDQAKILNECLNIFVTYLSDLRLIKAFYNEENIKHLEDLLMQPELVRSVCELIKIGIDNITFLGEHEREQAILSRRLITLQLHSSDQAVQIFTTILQRILKSNKFIQTENLFWLDEIKIGNKGQQFTDLKIKPLEILHIITLQWSLNYQLLKTSQYFYNEFAKIYSIDFENGDDVNDYHDEVEDKRNLMEMCELPKDYINYGDKTITDILKLNYNALSCFLLLPVENKSERFHYRSSKDDIRESISMAETSPSLKTTDENLDYLNPSMQTPLKHIGTDLFSIRTGSDTDINIDHNINDKISLSHAFISCGEESSFLYQLKQRCSSTDPCLAEIFDIRQQKFTTVNTNTKEIKDINNYEKSLLNTSIDLIQSSIIPPSSPSSPSSSPSTPLSEMGGLIFKLFGVFGTLFNRSSISISWHDSNESDKSDIISSNESNIQSVETDKDLQPLFEINGDCKKLLLKLFEATLSIAIKGYQNENDGKMQKHLQKLKELILSNAARNWQEYGEEKSGSQNIIMQTLQTLLRIAELSCNWNERTAGDSSNGIHSFTDEIAPNISGANSIPTAIIPTVQNHVPSRSISSSSRTPPTVINQTINGNVMNDTNSLILSDTQPPPPASDIIATQSPHKRPLSGDSSGGTTELDYFSTRASMVWPDSEIEFSENERDDFYLTADEGYEADGEIPEISDTEAELEAAAGMDMWTSFQVNSRYRSHALHDGLCQLVVEILIELSQLCVENPQGWCEHLTQLANRLFVIRENLGGPLFLLRGFAPVLECSDVQLKALQESLLELIVDLNTPDLLTAFFSILATKNPPIDVLIRYMSHICSTNTQRKPQPSVELEFPIVLDGTFISNGVDPVIKEQLDQIRNYHQQSQAITPFTRSPCFIPVTNTKLWSSHGFTLSLWTQIKSFALHKTSSQLIDDETRSSTDDYLKSHLVSIGSNQAMLSIYINNNMNLVFEVCKPSAQMKLPSPQSDETNDSAYPFYTNLSSTSHKHQNQKINSTSTYNQTLPPAAAPSSYTQTAGGNPSPLRNALKPIKLLVLNSFNQHIFNGHNSAAQTDSYFDGSSVELKNFRMMKNKWTHLCFTIDNLPDCLTVTIFIDGLDQHIISLPFRNLRSFTRSSQSLQLISLGDGHAVATTPGIMKSGNYSARTESRSSIESYPLRMGFANVLLFNRKIIVRDVIMNLTAMGPDFCDLTQCQVGNWKPNYGYLNFNKLHTPGFGNFSESMKLLRDSCVLIFSAQQPQVVICYDLPRGEDAVECLYGQQRPVIFYGELSQNHLKSLQTATILCGGFTTLMYLFARAVEISSNSITQSLALDILLNVALSDTQLYTEFQRQDCVSLIGFIIKTERCTKDVNLLTSIVNSACSQSIISKRGTDTLHVNDNTAASVIYPQLIVSILRRYSDWHRSGAENSDVLDTLFRCITALTREKHPHKEINMNQLSKAGLINEILNLCKVYIIESPNPVHISCDAAKSFVNILSVFAGSPPSPSLMDEIMKLLLLLHKPSECYITHDRSKFYFLLKSQPPPGKERSVVSFSTAANLTRVTAPFRRGFSRATERSSDSVNERVATNLLDAQRAARIKKLKKLHAQNSTYKRPVEEFEEHLESIADCSRLNKNALRSLSPVEAANWHAKYKRHSNLCLATSPRRTITSNKLHKSPSALMLPRTPTPQQRISRKRIRLVSSNSLRSLAFVDNERRCLRERERTSQSSVQSLFSYSSSATEAIGADGKKLPKPRVRTDFNNSPGIILLQEGLYTLLKDFLCLLPDSSVDEVLRHYVKAEFLLVLSNHRSSAVRTAIIKLLTALTMRLASNDVQTLIKSLYPIHLANQLSLYPTDVHMFEACLEWVSGLYGSLDAFLHYDFLRIQNRFGLNALLSVLTKPIMDQNEFTAKAFQILQYLFLKDTEHNQTLIEAGLLQCCMKALHNIYSRANILHHRTEVAVIDLLTKIGERSLKSVGHMNVIWDILNMCSFYQERESLNVVKGFRSVQGQLQLSWINLFFRKGSTPYSVIINGLSDATITPAEAKTRLDLLLDRCSQFFTISDMSYTPSEIEVKLFELLVTICLAINQRCNNFIAWGLQPSRPHALRAFIIDTLWLSCQDEFVPSIVCDGKMIKSLLWLCLLEDLPQPIPNLLPLCQHLGIHESDSIWNLENELERIEMNRCNISVKQKSLLDKTIHKFENLAMSCIESSMILTRHVAELQNAERKALMSHMKEYDETYLYVKLLEIVRRMTHEGAPWYSRDYAENSWELDDTEGPSRVHTRMRRCRLDIDRKFIMEDYRASSAPKKTSHSNQQLKISSFVNNDDNRYLEYLISSYDQQLNISFNCQVLHNFPAKYLPVDGEIDGEIIVTDHKIYFLATRHCKYFYVCCDIANITEIWLKRYQHQEKAFEIFLETNRSMLFSLQNQDDWKIMRDVFCDKIVAQPDQSKILLITQQWREGLLTNWEYLMTLNQIAGRTYNDLMQYPVFPWILSNYTSEVLDLTDSKNFRKLEKPIAVQNEENEQHYINNYSYINNTMTNMGSLVLKPYHYSSHYSNSGTVLHFLVRVPPFTSYFLRYQDNNFDLPDRTFHALSTTWSLASRDSPTDVKELIPEFFCLPEMFENFERFNFGCRQNGERVEDVVLPPWCARDPRLFMLIHRQALECELVRNNLHNWIDLIFGYKQTGENAVEAINVFHPATYSVFIESEIADPIERKAVETMVKTYGQMPRQLFKSAHPATKSLNYCLSADKEILQSVRGLRWGVYVGSPQLPKPKLGNIYKLPGAEYLVSFNSTNVVYGLPIRSCVMQGAEPDTFNVISWGHKDRIVRIQPLSKTLAKPKSLLYNSTFDDITACGTDPNSNQLWCGHRSGRISVYKCCNNDALQRITKSRQRISNTRGLRLSYNSAFRKMTGKNVLRTDTDADGCDLSSLAAHSNSSIGFIGGADGGHNDGTELSWHGPNVLIRHTDEIMCITLSVEFKIAVSAGRDGIAVIWDLNNWSYVRTIERPAEIHHSPITQVTISPTLGDIVTVHTITPHKSDEKREISGSPNNDNHSNETHVSPNTPRQQHFSNMSVALSPDECFEVTEENLDDFVNVSIHPSGKSILRLHSINARYIQHTVNEEMILAVCYSFIKEGVGVNVIATALEGGLVRLWSSWNLSFITDIVTGISDIRSVAYSTHQHLVVLTSESKIQVWETDSLYGNSPKFPQIGFKQLS